MMQLIYKTCLLYIEELNKNILSIKYCNLILESYQKDFYSHNLYIAVYNAKLLTLGIILRVWKTLSSLSGDEWIKLLLEYLLVLPPILSQESNAY